MPFEIWITYHCHIKVLEKLYQASLRRILNIKQHDLIPQTLLFFIKLIHS